MLGPLVAMRLGAAFVPVRKQGKLPGECVSAVYEKEYGEVDNDMDIRVYISELIYGVCIVGYL